jgi:hypothetical protein
MLQTYQTPIRVSLRLFPSINVMVTPVWHGGLSVNSAQSATLPMAIQCIAGYLIIRSNYKMPNLIYKGSFTSTSI